MSGVARAAIGWAGHKRKAKGQARPGQRGSLQPVCSRAGTRRPLSRARPGSPHHPSWAIWALWHFFWPFWQFGQFWHFPPFPQQHRVLGHASSPGLVRGCIGAAVHARVRSVLRRRTRRRHAGNQRTYGESPSLSSLPSPSPSPSCTSGHLLCPIIVLPTLTDDADPTACMHTAASTAFGPTAVVGFIKRRPLLLSATPPSSFVSMAAAPAMPVPLRCPLATSKSPPSGGHGSYAGAAGQPLPCAREPPYLYLYLYALGISRRDETRPTRLPLRTVCFINHTRPP